MNQEQLDMLTSAIERNAAAVLALPSAGMFRYHKTRFLRGVDERIWLEAVPEERILIRSLIETGEPAVVSFKIAQQKASFSAPILELNNQYRFFESDDPIPALLIKRPGLVKPQQRRTNYRVTLRPEDGFRIQLWRINDHADVRDQTTERCELTAKAVDLGTGGMGIHFNSKPLLINNQRLRLLLSWANREPMIIDCRCGPVRSDKNGFKAGLHFQHLQETLQGRQFLTELTRTVSGLQFEEARRIREKRKSA